MRMEKVVLTPTLAKHLLERGFRIVDLKPHKDDPRRTVFVFENCKELEIAVWDYKFKTQNEDLKQQ